MFARESKYARAREIFYDLNRKQARVEVRAFVAQRERFDIFSRVIEGEGYVRLERR